MLGHRFRTHAVAAALLGAVSVGSVTPAAADVIISAYPSTSSNGGQSLNGNGVINDAAGFTMGGSAFDLTSATVRLNATGIASFQSSVLHADLYGSSGGVPTGASLVSFTVPSQTIAGVSTDLLLTPVSAFQLAASTAYWLVLHVDASVEGNLAWSTIDTGSYIVTDASYLGATQDSSLPPTTLKPGVNLYFQIDGTPVSTSGGGDGEGGTGVPEPASLALLGAGLAAFGAVRRRRTA